MRRDAKSIEYLEERIIFKKLEEFEGNRLSYTTTFFDETKSELNVSWRVFFHRFNREFSRQSLSNDFTHLIPRLKSSRAAKTASRFYC